MGGGNNEVFLNLKTTEMKSGGGVECLQSAFLPVGVASSNTPDHFISGIMVGKQKQMVGKDRFQSCESESFFMIFTFIFDLLQFGYSEAGPQQMDSSPSSSSPRQQGSFIWTMLRGIAVVQHTRYRRHIQQHTNWCCCGALPSRCLHAALRDCSFLFYCFLNEPRADTLAHVASACAKCA